MVLHIIHQGEMHFLLLHRIFAKFLLGVNVQGCHLGLHISIDLLFDPLIETSCRPSGSISAAQTYLFNLSGSHSLPQVEFHGGPQRDVGGGCPSVCVALGFSAHPHPLPSSASGSSQSAACGPSVLNGRAGIDPLPAISAKVSASLLCGETFDLWPILPFSSQVSRGR